MTRFLRGVGRSAMRARLESPRASYATPGPWIGTTRAPRRRQLPTNHGHAARPLRATRVYQPDSSSKTPHLPLRAGALRNSFSFSQAELRTRPNNPLDRPSFHISYQPDMLPFWPSDKPAARGYPGLGRCSLSRDAVSQAGPGGAQDDRENRPQPHPMAAGRIEHPLRHFDRSLFLAQLKSALEHRPPTPDDGLINPNGTAVPRVPRNTGLLGTRPDRFLIVDLYSVTRPHQSLGNDSPRRRTVRSVSSGHIVTVPEVGGLHHRYQRAA
jgi:hypothetical protein